MRLLSIALITAAGLAVAVPAFAEDVIISGRTSGIGVRVDTGHHRDRTVVKRVYRDRDYASARCKTTIIKTDGMTKKIKRCD